MAHLHARAGLSKGFQGLYSFILLLHEEVGGLLSSGSTHLRKRRQTSPLAEPVQPGILIKALFRV